MDYRSSLERKIDAFYDSYARKLEEIWQYQKDGVVLKEGTGLAFCKEGLLSIFKGVYGLDVEYGGEQWCFRSEGTRDTTEGIVEAGQIDDIVKGIMDGIVGAVNNRDGYSMYRSFSKSMAAPLFKYYNGSALIFTQKVLNSVTVRFEVDCFDWCGEGDTSWDEYGNEYDRFHREEVEVILELKYLCSKKELLQRMLELLEGEVGSRFLYMDIDNIDFAITGFTIDVSKLDRGALDAYCNMKDMPKVKRHASYKKDREVISTEIGYPRYLVCCGDVIEILRFLYILAVSELQEEYEAVCAAYFGKELGSYEDAENEAVTWFVEYMAKNARAELESYQQIFNSEKDGYYIYPEQTLNTYYSKERIIRLLDNMKGMRMFANDTLYDKMKELLRNV